MGQLRALAAVALCKADLWYAVKNVKTKAVQITD